MREACFAKSQIVSKTLFELTNTFTNYHLNMVQLMFKPVSDTCLKGFEVNAVLFSAELVKKMTVSGV